jgi:hypothetical protein
MALTENESRELLRVVSAMRSSAASLPDDSAVGWELSDFATRLCRAADGLPYDPDAHRPDPRLEARKAERDAWRRQR